MHTPPGECSDHPRAHPAPAAQAYRKHEAANASILALHSDARKLLDRLVTYAADGAEVDDALQEIRRYLILACVLKEACARGERPLG